MHNVTKTLLLAAAVLLFAACEHSVKMETTVHADGSLDKAITFEQKNKLDNLMALDSTKGWKSVVTEKNPKPDSLKKSDKNDEDWVMYYQKSFPSAEAANLELASPSDTLLRVSSNFEKKFRWFYSYIHYSETYHALNTMSYPPTDFVTPEDYQFIDRLPAEGKAISKADSLQLVMLNEKLFDIYGMKAFYEEYFAAAQALLDLQGVEPRWKDTLNRHKQNFFYLVNEEKSDINDDFFPQALDSIKIPLDYNLAAQQFPALAKISERKINFISHASDGEYTNIINMPWEVVRSNADSTAGQQLIWNPPTIKFLLKDYTMYAEARKMNYWAVLVTLLVIGFTGYLFVRKR